MFAILRPSYLFFVVALLPAVSISCSPPPPPPVLKQTFIWQKLGTWSGRGSLQTESFVGVTGYLRFTWATTNEPKPNAGHLKITLLSSISGRPLGVPVDAQGVGKDVGYVNEDPRSFYALVDSADVDWTFTVDEGSTATIEEKVVK